MKDTILVISDYFIGEPNSVSDILLNLYEGLRSKNDFYFLLSNPKTWDYKYNKKNAYNYFYGKDDAIKKRIIRKIYKEDINIYYFKKIIKKIKMKLIIYLVYSPTKLFIDLFEKFNIPYLVILYDTYIKRPGLDFLQSKKLEESFINNSLRYYIPDWFYKDYETIYKINKVKCMYLPLLNKKNYFNLKEKPIDKFGYYGQIQSFRNYKKIKEIFNLLKIKLSIHSTSKIEYDDTFIESKSLVGKDLYESINSTKFLVIFDNSIPYNHYLPSKTILYMSFGKPIIVFTDNNESILIDYLKNYKYKIVVYINKPNLNELKEFIKQNNNNKSNFEYGFSITESYFYNNSLKELNELVSLIKK